MCVYVYVYAYVSASVYVYHNTCLTSFARLLTFKDYFPRPRQRPSPRVLVLCESPLLLQINADSHGTREAIIFRGISFGGKKAHNLLYGFHVDFQGSISPRPASAMGGRFLLARCATFLLGDYSFGSV